MTAATQDSTGGALPRRGLLGLLAAAALSQVLIQTQAYGGNPVVLVPSSDAAVLWERAGEIAVGQLVDDMPLDTAPLPLWLAACVRALGGGLAAFGVVQSLLYVLTAGLLASASARLARRAGIAGAGSIGLLAGALFLLLDEPAAGTSRVLAGTLQLALASGLIWILSASSQGPDGSQPPGARRVASQGALLGLMCLAYPPALAAVPLLALAHLRAGGVKPAVLTMAASAALIAPATVHNLAASGEPVLISSQAGLTFYHGNNAGADGLIAPVGVVNEKATQAQEALAVARRELGETAGWRDADAHWRGKGLEWWAEDPVRATTVAFKKLWYALSGRRYGDVYQPWRERADGTASMLWLAPIPVAWIVPLALFALLGIARRRLAGLPLGSLVVAVALPLVICVVFFYSPRYRTPLIAGAVPLAALAVGEMLACRSTQDAAGRRLSITVVTALLIGIVAGPVNRALDFDRDVTGAFQERHFERLAQASGALGEHGEGLRYLGMLLERRPEDPQLRSRVARIDLLLVGNEARALELLRAAPEPAASHPDVIAVTSLILSTARDDSLRDGARALELADGLLATYGGVPAFLDLRAMALARLGQSQEAVEIAAQAASMLTAGDPLRTVIEQRVVLYQSGQPFVQPPIPSQ